MADILCVGNLPQDKDRAIDAEYSPEDDVVRYSVDSLGDSVPESEARRPRRVERAAPARGPAPMSGVPGARRTEDLENRRGRLSLPCSCDVCPCRQLSGMAWETKRGQKRAGQHDRPRQRVDLRPIG